jgi:hypothetical protein
MASLRKAINAQCKDCIYDSYDKGTWRQQVEECTSYNCSLYPVRPRPIATKKEAIPDDTESFVVLIPNPLEERSERQDSTLSSQKRSFKSTT